MKPPSPQPLPHSKAMVQHGPLDDPASTGVGLEWQGRGGQDGEIDFKDLENL